MNKKTLIFFNKTKVIGRDKLCVYNVNIECGLKNETKCKKKTVDGHKT